MHKFASRFLLGFSIGLAVLVGAAGISGCHGAATSAASAPDNSGPDPADANMAPVDNSQPQGQVLGVSSQAPAQQSSEEYAQQQAPPPPGQGYPSDQDAQDYNQLNADADAGQPAEYADQPPPPLPVYEQPEAPEPNYLWTPGYWAWGSDGYYWVPGAWCAPPYYGALWTPGYWGFYGGRYGFHHGYWGTHIGFYGGVNYGFGYTGTGYYGGYWNGNNFYYNRSVNRINTGRINYVYNRTVPNRNAGNRVSYNGGRGGLNVRPQAAEVAAMRGPRTPAMSTQVQNQREASQNRQQFYNTNKGRPAVAAAARPIAAQPGIQRPNPGTRPGQPENRPGQPQTRPGQPENRPGQPQTRPGQPATQPARPGQPAARPGQPENRPGQPQARPVQPQQQTRPAQPQNRPAPQQARPQPQSRPAPQQARPQPQARPAPQQAHPQPQARPAPQQAHPQPQAQPHQAPPKQEEKPH